MKKYQPSNGTEGMYFTDAHCMQCLNCDPDPNGAKQCKIWLNTMLHNVNDPGYPKEWIYDEDNKPTCTAWVKWDWNDKGDPDDPDNPNKPPIPYNPNQLLLFSEVDEFQRKKEFV